MLGTNTSTLPTLRIDFSDHPFIKHDIFEGDYYFPPRGTLPLASQQNTVNNKACHTYLNHRITSHGIIHFQLETGQMFGSSALAENNQHHHVGGG